MLLRKCILTVALFFVGLTHTIVEIPHEPVEHTFGVHGQGAASEQTHGGKPKDFYHESISSKPENVKPADAAVDPTISSVNSVYYDAVDVPFNPASDNSYNPVLKQTSGIKQSENTDTVVSESSISQKNGDIGKQKGDVPDQPVLNKASMDAFYDQRFFSSPFAGEQEIGPKNRMESFLLDNGRLNQRLQNDYGSLKILCNKAYDYVQRNDTTSFDTVRDLQNKMSDYMVEVYGRYKNATDLQEKNFLTLVKEQLQEVNALLRKTVFQKTGVLTLKNEPISLVKRFKNWWLTLTDSNFAKNYALKITDVTPIDNFIKIFNEQDKIYVEKSKSFEGNKGTEALVPPIVEWKTERIRKELAEYEKNLKSLNVCINEYEALKVLADCKGFLKENLLGTDRAKWSFSKMIDESVSDQAWFNNFKDDIEFLLKSGNTTKEFLNIFNCPETNSYALRLMRKQVAVKVPSRVAQDIKRGIDTQTMWSQNESFQTPRYEFYRKYYETQINLLKGELEKRNSIEKP